MEFVRCIYENNIPLQPAQQTMILAFLFKAKQYPVLHQLLQFHVFLDSLELARVLVELGSRQSKKTDTYYEPAFQLGLDMLQRLKQYQDIVIALVNEDYIMKALDFAIEHEVVGMKLNSLLESVEIAKQRGDDIKAAMIAKRLQELKKVSTKIIIVQFDEMKLKLNSSYKSLLVQ